MTVLPQEQQKIGDLCDGRRRNRMASIRTPVTVHLLMMLVQLTRGSPATLRERPKCLAKCSTVSTHKAVAWGGSGANDGHGVV